jgi:hypothetical protein
MRLGYSTNSIGDIPLLEALPILQGLGYSSLAITLDHHVLNPFGGSLPAELARWQAALTDGGVWIRRRTPSAGAEAPCWQVAQLPELVRELVVSALEGRGW